MRRMALEIALDHGHGAETRTDIGDGEGIHACLRSSPMRDGALTVLSAHRS